MHRRHLRSWVTAALVVLTTAAWVLAGASPAAAHDSTSEAIAVTITDERVLGTAPVLFTELGFVDTSGDGLIDTAEVEAQESGVATGLVDAVRDHVRLDVDGQQVDIIGAGLAPITDGDDPSEYVDVLFATEPRDGDISEIDVAWSFTSPSDQVVLSGPDVLVTGELSDDGAATFTLDATSTARSFFRTGIDHVVSGLDHLLFLVVLTFAVVGSAVTRSSAWRVIGLVTAFTIGHATSLCLAYFDVVSVPARWVEPAIALSIVVAAVLALRGKGDGIRPWIAGVVGLVHGLGFASSLGGLGLSTSNHVSALAAFNIGIDAAQTAAVLLVTGTIWLSVRVLGEGHRWIRLLVCGSAGVVGLVWTISRLLP